MYHARRTDRARAMASSPALAHLTCVCMPVLKTSIHRRQDLKPLPRLPFLQAQIENLKSSHAHESAPPVGAPPPLGPPPGPPPGAGEPQLPPGWKSAQPLAPAPPAQRNSLEGGLAAYGVQKLLRQRERTTTTMQRGTFPMANAFHMPAWSSAQPPKSLYLVLLACHHAREPPFTPTG